MSNEDWSEVYRSRYNRQLSWRQLEWQSHPQVALLEHVDIVVRCELLAILQHGPIPTLSAKSITIKRYLNAVITIFKQGYSLA